MGSRASGTLLHADDASCDRAVNAEGCLPLVVDVDVATDAVGDRDVDPHVAVGAGVGGAVGGSATGPDQKNVTIEHRDTTTTGSVGCSTTTKSKTDEFGDTSTKQKTEC